MTHESSWTKVADKISSHAKYVGVQSWKAMHLPTLDIRVKQKGNRAIKWETHFGILLKSGKKIEKIAAAGNRTRDLAICVVFSSRQIRLFWFCAVLWQKKMEKGLIGEFCSSRQIRLFWFCAVLWQKKMEEGLVAEFCSSRQTGYFDFVQYFGKKRWKKAL